MVGAQPVAVLCRRSGQRMSRKGEHIVSAAALGAAGIHALGVDLHAHILSLLYRTGQIVGPGLPKYIAHQQDSSKTGVRAGGNGVTDQYDYTPWTSDGAASNTTDAYGTAPDSERDYLGRYGMVRNNWYDVNVTAFKSLGSPVVPDAKVTTSDDNESEEKWISFQVKVLSWAKRTQDHEF